ncbi:unnamed protein product [Pseudo-nitzschia multistriata]|uniref:Uncharacterized protein n=1 Tax=Pseudo-nitzschia multistriata TaxID=183589 RepID=A0A448YVY6_9STRA|nr:unnamed protein product [Pseudo-nitzschia multistriata]
MVSTMANAYNTLTDEDRERVFMLAVGQNDYSMSNQNFCQGFAACADESGSPWWNDVAAAQRDVIFYMKTDPTDDSSWEFYCHYSMNTGRGEFADTIQEMLSITAANAMDLDESDFLGNGTDVFGNETMFEPDELSSNSITAMSSVSSSSSMTSTFLLSIMVSGSILVWSMQ